MSSALKCPNPSCPYLFDPTSVPPGVVLACPRCGMRFTLGPPGPPPPGIESPTADYPGGPTVTYPGGLPRTDSPPATSGYASPSAPTYPSASRPPAPRSAAAGPGVAVGGVAPDAARADGRQGPRRPVRGNRYQTPILVGVAAVALAGAAVAIWFKINPKPDGPSDNATQFADVNLSFEPPPKPWERDGDMKANKLGHPYFLVYKRDNPEAVMAFGAKDYADRDPRPSELTLGLKQALGRILEPGTLSPFDPEEGRWLGQPLAAGFRFRGKLKAGQAVEGDAYAVAHKGVGYWFLAWAAEGEGYAEQKGEFAEARKRCKLLDPNKEWRPGRANVVPFKGDTVPYTILDAEDVWAEVNDPAQVKATDPKADKLLRTKPQKKQKGRDFPDEADLVILLLDPGGDPLQTARAHVEAQANADPAARGMNTFTVHAGGLEGDPVPDAGGNAPVVILRSTNDRSAAQTWLYVISAVSSGDKTVAVCAKCKWSDRAAFDTKFAQIAKSLRPE